MFPKLLNSIIYKHFPLQSAQNIFEILQKQSSFKPNKYKSCVVKYIENMLPAGTVWVRKVGPGH